MRLLFDLTPLYDHLSGIERYAMNITRCMVMAHPDHEYILVFKKEIHPTFFKFVDRANIHIDVLKECDKLLFQQYVMSRYLRKQRNIDYFFFLASPCPFLFRHKGIICTVHDMSPWDCPDSMRKKQVIYGKLSIASSVKASTLVGTVSEFSKKRIMDILKVQEDRIVLAHNGLSSIFERNEKRSIEALMEKYGIPGRYILCLSTLEPRKNMRLLIRAYLDLKESADIDACLVLAGRKGWKLNDALGETDTEKNDIIVTGFVEDNDLPALYKGADAFIFPSLYEGFGIPVIEAMSQGTVVISSNSSSLPEVGGDAALYFENNSLDGLKKAIIDFYNLSMEDKDLHRQLGIQQSKIFDWEKESEKYHQAIIANITNREN